MTPYPPISLRTPRLLWWGPPGSGKTEQVVRELTWFLGNPAFDPVRALLVLPNSHAVELVRRRLFHDSTLAAFSDRPLVAISQLPERLGVRVQERQLGELRARLLVLAALGETGRTAEGPLTALRSQEGLVQVLQKQIRECKEWGYLPAKDLALAGTERLGLPVFPWTDLGRRYGRDKEVLAQFRKVWLHYERLKQEGGWVDQADELLLACAAVEAGDAQPLDWLAIDGFDDLTPLQWRLLDHLGRRTPTVRLTLPTDSSQPQFFNPNDPRQWILQTLERQGTFVAKELQHFSRSGDGPLRHLQVTLPVVLHPEAVDSSPALTLEPGAPLRFW